MIIEFFGLSCVGKSTLIHATLSKLSHRGLQADVEDQEDQEGRRSRLRQVADLVHSPALTAWGMANFSRWVSGRGRTFARATVDAASVSRAGSQGILLIDEGPLKQYATLARGSRLPTLLARSMPRPDLAVLVECDVAVRLRRLGSSDRSHIVGMTEVQLRENHRYRTLWNRWVSDALSLRTMIVDTTNGDDSSEHLASTIQQLTRNVTPSSDTFGH